MKVLEYINEQLKQEINELYILASLLKEKYEDELKTISKDCKFKTRYFPDVREKGEGIYIYWQDFIKRNMSLKDIPFDRRKKIYGRVVRMPKTGYSPKSFKQTHEKEKEAIMHYENLFSDIRKRAKFLKRTQYYIYLAMKSDLDKSYEEIKDFV